jgi:hypothetical protein
MVELTITLSDEQVARLRKEAEKANLPVEEYLVKKLDQEDRTDELPPPNTIEAHVAASERANIGGDKTDPPAEPGTLGALLESAKRANIGAFEPDVPPSGERTWEDDWYDHLTRYQRDQDG